MDVSLSNVLESTRQYFQGVPSNSPKGGGGYPTSEAVPPNIPGAATPVQPQQHTLHNNPPSSPAVLPGGYWHPQHTQSPATSHATLTSPRLPELDKGATRLQHNLPPIAALSFRPTGPLPSISHINPKVSHFRSPDYPHSMYDLNSVSSQSRPSPSLHYPQTTPTSKYQATPTLSSYQYSASNATVPHSSSSGYSSSTSSSSVYVSPTPNQQTLLEQRLQQQQHQQQQLNHQLKQQQLQQQHQRRKQQQQEEQLLQQKKQHALHQHQQEQQQLQQQQQQQQQHNVQQQHQQKQQLQQQHQQQEHLPQFQHHHQQQPAPQPHQQLQAATMFQQHSAVRQNEQTPSEQLQHQSAFVKSRHYAAQQQAYYSSSSSTLRPAVPVSNSVLANNHQRSAVARTSTGIVKRESPLDLSVKTIRQSADSTAKDDTENLYNNLAAFQVHDFHHQTKIQPKAPGSRANASIPLQLPSSVAYPTFDSHGNANPPTTLGSSSLVGTPKVDFLPNFSTTHHAPSLNQEVKKRSRKSSQASNPSQYPVYQTTLPNMSSFKKNVSGYELNNKVGQYYPSVPARQHQPLSTDSNLSTSVHPTYTMAQYQYDPTKHTAAHEYASRLPGSTPIDPVYKRSSSSDLRHPTASKVPRVDTWRQTIDQQIEQRLNSYASSRAQQMNGTSPIPNSSTVNHSQSITSFQQQTTLNMQSSQHHPSMLNRHTSYQRQPIMASIPTYHTNLQYPNQTSTRSTLDTYQPQQTVQRLPDLPNNNGAVDKKVLSILRNNLEIKGARQLQQQQQQKQQQQLIQRSSVGKTYHTMEPRQPALMSSHSKMNAPPPAPSLGRHNLPPFGAISAERTSTPPNYASHKFHIPKAVDSIRPEYDTGALPLAARRYNLSIPPMRTDLNQNYVSHQTAPQSSGELDGLADFLAARIRTKAELKQVGSSQDQQLRCLTPSSSILSGSNSSVHSSPPQQVVPFNIGVSSGGSSRTPQHEAERGPQCVSSAATSHSSAATSHSSSGSSPPKLLRERVGSNAPRRRLFSRSEDEHSVSAGSMLPAARADSCDAIHVPPSGLGLRSSSETSVFDFRESDSESEMPVLERQSLHGMRRDRDKRWLLKTSTPVATTAPDEEDPFWSETCEQFVEQLQTGTSGLRRRGRRKKPLEAAARADTSQELTNERAPAPEPPVVTVPAEVKEDCIANNEEYIGIKVEGNKEDLSAGEGGVNEKEVALESVVKAEESSDEDIPLSRRKEELKREKQEPLELVNRVSDGSSDDESIGAVARRLRIKKKRESQGADKMLLRTRESSKSPKKANTKLKQHKKKKKKIPFGDGSDFHPGWEEDLYNYKRSVRMPAQLISILRPPSWHRASVSLPDLDPCPDSPMTSELDVSQRPQKVDSPDLKKDDGRIRSTIVPCKSKNLDEEDSFLDRLMLKIGPRQNDSKTYSIESKEKLFKKENKVPKIIPRSSDGPELPHTLNSDIPLLSAKDKAAAGVKAKRGRKPKNMNKSDCDTTDSVLLGYFKKKNVSTFSEAFVRRNGSLTIENKLLPLVFKSASKTRTEKRALKQQATIREAFGEDRPASAPPAGYRDDLPTLSEDRVPNKKKTKLLRKRGNSSNTGPGRPGLRSAGMLRSNKAVMNSKRQLLNSGSRRKHKKNLLKVYAANGLKCSLDKCEVRHLSEKLSFESEVKTESTLDSQLIAGKRLKLRTMRRKFRSGFDYIRKKVNKHQKKEGKRDILKEKRKCFVVKQTPECEQDIKTEIKGWVMNKGLGETLLHRAARLGYTDVAAYCLARLEHTPSPRDNAGYTPLHEACSRGHLKIAKLLLQHGANVSDNAIGGIRPLHEATENGYTELMRLLLSYGADPLLATYSGQTPLSLASSESARQLLQYHLADVQGHVAPPWTFHGPASCFDPVESGFDPLVDLPPPSPELAHDMLEIEQCDEPLPTIYRLCNDPQSDSWVLLHDLSVTFGTKTKESALKKLTSEFRDDIRDMKLTDFHELAKSNILGASKPKFPPKTVKVTLVRYNSRLKSLLGIEIDTLPAR